jgi:hypothetical protein
MQDVKANAPSPGQGVAHAASQVLPRSRNALLVLASALALLAAMAMLFMGVHHELEWINASAREAGKCAGPAFWIRVFDLKAAILLRMFAIGAGAAIMFAGMATSYIVVTGLNKLDGGERLGNLSFVSASPGLFGVVVGGIVVSFALAQSASLGGYTSPGTDWCSQSRAGVTVHDPSSVGEKPVVQPYVFPKTPE